MLTFTITKEHFLILRVLLRTDIAIFSKLARFHLHHADHCHPWRRPFAASLPPTLPSLLMVLQMPWGWVCRSCMVGMYITPNHYICTPCGAVPRSGMGTNWEIFFWLRLHSSSKCMHRIFWNIFKWDLWSIIKSGSHKLGYRCV